MKRLSTLAAALMMTTGAHATINLTFTATGVLEKVQSDAPWAAGYFIDGDLWTDVGFGPGVYDAIYLTEPRISTTVYSSNFQPGYASVYDTSDFIAFKAEHMAATPEPSTWAMMLLGFVGLAFPAAFRKRLRKVSLG